MVSVLTTRERTAQVGVLAAILFAALLFLLPFISPIHRLPLPTFDSECLAALLLSCSLAALLFAGPVKARLNWPLPALLAAMVTLATFQYLNGRLDYSYQLTTFVLAVVGILAAYALGRSLVAADVAATAVYAIAVAIVVGGVFSHVVQWMQIRDVASLPVWLYFPMERERPFRAVANLGQPNQLAVYFAMGLVALLFLQCRGWRPSVARVLGALMAGGIALTQSRMGLIMVMLLALACLAGPLRALAGQRRSAIIFWIAALAGYVLAWIAAPVLATNLDGALAPDKLLSQSTGLMRLEMWADALKVITAHPLLGVGAGQYADAQYWVADSPSTLGTPYVHNLLLQAAAEFGVLMGLSLFGLILWWAVADWRSRVADPAIAAVWTWGLLIVLHSLLEWPLWVFFVAVPAGLLFGLAEPELRRSGAALVEARKVLAPVGVAALCYVPLMFADYDRVSVAAQLLFREQVVGKAASLEAKVAILEIGDATFFKPQIDRQVLSLLSPRKPVEQYDIELTRRVLSRLPDDRVIARYITLLALDGKVEEAIRHVERMQVFAYDAERYLQAEQMVLKGIASEGEKMNPLRQRLAEARR
jgi:hypothetical protein